MKQKEGRKKKHCDKKDLMSAFLSLSFVLLLSGCNFSLLDSKGEIGVEQKSLILTVLSLTLVVIIPAILMAGYFAWKYRANNKDAQYSPTWSHSNKVEIVVWGVPILIVLFLSMLSWKTTHLLEPSKPIFQDKKPFITIEVVSTDWKWFFIYPEKGIATINEIAFPVNVSILFKVTSHSVMNSFFIPRLGSQIYAMAGMQTKLYLIANESGIYEGISANFSGKGFSNMKFKVIAMKNLSEFDQWVKKAKNSKNSMSNISTFEKVAEPSEDNKVEYFSNVKPNLFQDIIDQFIKYGMKPIHNEKTETLSYRKAKYHREI